MAYREVTMLELKEVLRLWLSGAGKKPIAAQLGLDVTTVRRDHGAGGGLWAGRGGAARHRLDDSLGAGPVRQTPSLPRLDLHCGALAPPLRLRLLRGDDAHGDRRLRGSMGVLRRHLPRACR